jgi:cation transport ATPase
VDAAGGNAEPPESFEARPSQGLVAQVQGQAVAIGGANLMVAEGIAVDTWIAPLQTPLKGDAPSLLLP